MSHITQHRLAFVLAIVVALGPFALDAYLPAFVVIGREFGLATSEVALTLSVYVLGMAIGQLIGGPLSDRHGRALILFSGIACFILGSIVVAVAPSMEWMLIGRFIQAFGGGWSTVNVPAIVRDRTEGNETARLFSLIAMIMFIAPAIAPSIGSGLLELGGWRSIFYFQAVYALFAAFLLRMTLFNSEAPRTEKSAEPLHRLLTNYLEVLKHRDAMRFMVMQSFSFSIMLVYLGHAAFIYQEWMGFSNLGFSLLFAANVGVMTVMSLLNRRLLLSWKSADVLTLGLGVQALALLAFGAVVLFELPPLLAVPALALTVGSMGAIAPNNMASALQYFRKLAGTAAALIGAMQFSVAGAISALSASIAGDEIVMTVLMMAGCAAVPLLLIWPARRAALRGVDRTADETA
ncbi:MAG TPA: multidrug effflux MFS transporter [Gammaproteobacteria bacterium]|nr:multidrug effflux MFS transporter [Gammaproteobacteria bacterium]